MRRSLIKSKSTVKRRSLKRGTKVPEGSKNPQKRRSHKKGSKKRSSPRRTTFVKGSNKPRKRSYSSKVTMGPLPPPPQFRKASSPSRKPVVFGPSRPPQPVVFGPSLPPQPVVFGPSRPPQPVVVEPSPLPQPVVVEQPRRSLLQYDPSLSYLDVLPYLSKIRYIEGPVRYLVMTPTERLKNILGRNPPIIIALGDEHEIRTKCGLCGPGNGCYTLYESELNGNSFLGYFNKLGEKFQVDFFYESWVNKQYRKQLAEEKLGKSKYVFSKSALVDMMYLLRECSMKHTNISQYISCPYKSINTHYVDVRKNFSGIEDIYLERRDGKLNIKNTSIKEYSEIFENIDGIIPYMKDKDFTFTEFKTIFENVFKGEKVGDVLDLMIQRFTIGADRFYKEVFRTNPLMIKYSKVHKQIRQLPIELQDILYTYPIWTFQDFQLVEGINRMSDEVEYEIVMYNLKNRIHELDVNWLGVSGVDLYYLARTLKIPKWDSKLGEGNPTQISLIYLGDNHINLTKDFLVKSGLFIINKEVIDEKYKKYENKCLVIQPY